jgi:hypothetical protein
MVSIPVQSQIEVRRINSMPRALEIPLSTAKAATGNYGQREITEETRERN